MPCLELPLIWDNEVEEIGESRCHLLDAHESAVQ